MKFTLLMLLFLSVSQTSMATSVDFLTDPLLSSSTLKNRQHQFKIEDNPTLQEYLGAALGESWKFFQDGQYKKAYPFIRLDATRGLPAALFLLGQIYEEGLQKPRSPEKASRYYTQAFDKGIKNREDFLLAKEAEFALNRVINFTKEEHSTTQDPAWIYSLFR